MIAHSDLIQLGTKLGLHKLGVARVTELEKAAFLDQWLHRGYHGDMEYMARNSQQRKSPLELLPDARSVISVFVNYYQENDETELDGIISRYARGQDYHRIMKDKLHTLALELFTEELDTLTRKERAKIYRVFVDSAPIMDKLWAVEAGLGWQGKNSNLITREYGSWGFLGEIVTCLEFDVYDSPGNDYCGTCTACIDACPTQAIVEPYVVDGSRCISYATIELQAEKIIPDDIRHNMGKWIFGCDVCQDVCPWNRFARTSDIQEFKPLKFFLENDVQNLLEMDELQFDTNFHDSPLNRPGLSGLLRNINARK